MHLITDTPFDPAKQIKNFTNASGNAGAIASFIGRVRGESGDVQTLHLEHYPGVTEAGIESAEQDARTRWQLLDVLIVHRVGTMTPGEPIVLVATAAAHRRAAFEACDYLMDYLKTDAVFWKKQMGRGGSKWIEPRPQDYQDKERWS